MSINKFMDKIKAKYPEVTLVTTTINDAKENIYKGWDVKVVNIRLAIKGSYKFISIPEIIEMFGGRPSLRLSKNTSKRCIVKNKFIKLHIDNCLESFSNPDGERISYYPTESFTINIGDDIKKLKSIEGKWEEALNRLYEERRKQIDLGVDEEEIPEIE